MNNIELYSEKLPSLLKEVDSFPDLQVGNFLIKKNANSYNVIAEVVSIDIVKKKKWTKEGWVDTEEDTVEIKVQYYDLSLNKRGNVTLLDSGFKEKETVKFTSKEHLEQYLNQAQSILDSGFNQEEKQEPISDDTSLVAQNKQFLIDRKNAIEEAQGNLEVLYSSMNIVVQRQKDYLDSIRSKMEKELSVMRTKISRLADAIFKIELYCGIEEEVVVLKQGQPSNSKIRLYQETLYMDEEIGDWKDQGLSVTNIKDFDEWLLRDNHLDFFIQEKGIRLFQPRRDYKKLYYKVNKYLTKFELDEDLAEKHTYLLIRNGENVYRIWTQLRFGDKLFPNSDEINKLLKANESGSSWAEQDLYNTVNKYQRNFLVIQGLLDRTELLSPHTKFNLLKDQIDSIEDIELIYDMEFTKLPTGFLSFRDFKREINSKIKEGSRVFFLCAPGFSDDHERRERFDYVYYNYTPDAPEMGIYTVYQKDKEGKEEKLVIHYLPTDKVFKSWRDGFVERKKKVSFRVYRGDWFLLNYDELTIEDVEFYLNNRLDRRYYLEYMEALETVRELLIKERDTEEIPFIKMLEAEGYEEKDIIEGIKWWKNKGKFKRFIHTDDAKAYRMIKAYCERLYK